MLSRIRLPVVAVVAMAVVLSACGGLGENAGGDVSPGPAGADAIVVVMKDNTFEPNVLELPAGTESTLEVRNEGEMNHNFTVDSLGVSTGPMEPGDVMTVRLTAPSGSSEFRCTWHPEMTGTINAS